MLVRAYTVTDKEVGRMTMRGAIRWMLVAAALLGGGRPAEATLLNVTTAPELQSALDAAGPGDEIVLADGIYSGQFNINKASGMAAAPITVRAANRHRAVLAGDNACNRFHEGLVAQRPYWVIKDLKFMNHGRAISI